MSAEHPPRRRLIAAHPDHDFSDLYEMTWEGDDPADEPLCDVSDEGHTDWERVIAPELVRRWNAFEEGGAVRALMAAAAKTDGLYQDMRNWGGCAGCANYYDGNEYPLGEPARAVVHPHSPDCPYEALRAALAALEGDAQGER